MADCGMLGGSRVVGTISARLAARGEGVAHREARRRLVNDPETGEFEAELISGSEDFTPHFRHLIETATNLFCS